MGNMGSLLMDIFCLQPCSPMRKLAWEGEAPYCFSRNLLRKVARPAMTEEKLH